jgi:uncharacterized protein (DUF1330 family)
MKGYVIFTREKTLDEAEMAIYSEAVPSTFAEHPVKILALYGKHEVVEGEPTEGAVILEFPSFEAAKDWYDSPAYTELRKHRFNGAIYRGILVEGM